MNEQRPSGGDGAERTDNKNGELRNEVLEKVIGQLLTHVLRCGLRYDEAAEVVQQTVVRYLEQGSTAVPEPIDRVRGWFFTTANRLVLNRFRERRRHPMQSLHALPIDVSDVREELRADREREERRLEWLRRWMEKQDRHSINYRLVYGHYFEKCRMRALAVSLGLSYHAAVVRLGRVRAKIGEWILQHMKDELEPS